MSKVISSIIFKKKIWRTSVLFVGTMITLFGISGDVCPGFQSQGGSPCLLASSPVCNRNLRFTSGATPTDLVVKSNLKFVQIYSVRPVYTKRQGQRFDETGDNALIGNNRVAPEWVTTRL